MIGRYRYLTGTGTDQPVLLLVPVLYRYLPVPKKKKKSSDSVKKCIAFQLLLIFFNNLLNIFITNKY
jgi:hypothetical protein